MLVNCKVGNFPPYNLMFLLKYMNICYFICVFDYLMLYLQPEVSDVLIFRGEVKR